MESPRGYGGGGVGTSSVERAVEGMSIGPIAAHEARRTEDWKDSLDEYDAQFQCSISGKPTYKTRWATLDVEFGVAFVVDPNRDSPYSTPTFTFGVESRGTAIVVVYVTGWKGGSEGITGASLKVGMVNPGVKQPVQFSGKLHLNFQGYGAPSGDDFDEEGDG